VLVMRGQGHIIRSRLSAGWRRWGTIYRGRSQPQPGQRSHHRRGTDIPNIQARTGDLQPQSSCFMRLNTTYVVDRRHITRYGAPMADDQRTSQHELVTLSGYPELLRAEDVAEILRISVPAARKRMERGRFTVFRDGSNVRVPREELRRYILSNLVPAREGSATMAVRRSV